jgi:rubrerythrin
MTAVESTTTTLSDQHLALILQYTVEAYKTFEKLAENLPNPMAAGMFKQFAEDEREVRDLLELKYATGGRSRLRVTLGADMLFQEMLEGDLTYRAMTEFLISRERTMEKKLRELAASASAVDKNLLIYIAASKRAHIVELERELELIRLDPDWYRREDAEARIVNGPGGV